MGKKKKTTIIFLLGLNLPLNNPIKTLENIPKKKKNPFQINKTHNNLNRLISKKITQTHQNFETQSLGK